MNTFDPALKFSGKERDSESNLDYFGARYYDHTLYRFLSVDPVIPAGRALYNPQRWNLYGYCGDNPINYIDLGGGDPIRITIVLKLIRTSYQPEFTRGLLFMENPFLNRVIFLGHTLERAGLGNIKFESCVKKDIYDVDLAYFHNKDLRPKLEDKNGRSEIFIHWAEWVYKWENGVLKWLLKGCISLAWGIDLVTGFLIRSQEAVLFLSKQIIFWKYEWPLFVKMMWGYDLEVRFVLSIEDAPSIPEGTVTTSYYVSGIAK